MGPCFGSCCIRGTLDRPKAEYIVANYVRPFQQNEKREAQMGKVILLTFFMTFLIIPATRAECDRLFVKENALFIHASVECKKDYMDSKAGKYVLQMAKQCIGLGKQTIDAISMESMREFDTLVAQKGRGFACQMADEIENRVLQEAQ
jgi:hypothetical protein